MNNPYGYTWRERLADWISGGALSLYIEQAVAAKLDAVHARQRATATPGSPIFREIEKAYTKRSIALAAIHAATKDGKSGTARKVARMAEEALK